MTNRYFILTASIYIFAWIFALYSGDFFTSLIMIFSPVFFFIYFLYIVLNYRQRDKNFNKKLLLLPAFLFLIFVSLFSYIEKLSDQLDSSAREKAVVTYTECKKYGCNESGRFSIGKFILEKDYFYFYKAKEDCLRVYSANYSVFKQNYLYCGDK